MTTARAFTITERNSAALRQARSLNAISPICRPGQCRFENGHYRRVWKRGLRTEMKDRADKAVAAISIMITTSRPVSVVGKKLQHQIQYLQRVAGRIRGPRDL